MDYLGHDTKARLMFVTNLGLITTNGPNGYNIMTCEWTHHVSYSPSIVQVNVHGGNATAENIIASKEFGISLAADDQNMVCSIGGWESGKLVDKIGMLKELGVPMHKAKKIDAWIVDGSPLVMECKLKEYKQLGDHVCFIGDVVYATENESIKPLIRYNRHYFKLGEQVQKPDDTAFAKLDKLAEKHSKKN